MDAIEGGLAVAEVWQRLPRGCLGCFLKASHGWRRHQPKCLMSNAKTNVAMTLESTEEELMHTVFPHPTLSEMMHESVLDAYGKVIHT